MTQYCDCQQEQGNSVEHCRLVFGVGAHFGTMSIQTGRHTVEYDINEYGAFQRLNLVYSDSNLGVHMGTGSTLIDKPV